jgi:hypothetical protein
MTLELDAILAFGSLGLTLIIALVIRVAFRPGRDLGDY